MASPPPAPAHVFDTALEEQRLLYADSTPALATASQQSIVVIDSQGDVTSEPGPGALRDMQDKAERHALVADARAEVYVARAALAAADAVVVRALENQTACQQRLLASKQLLHDMTAKPQA